MLPWQHHSRYHFSFFPNIHYWCQVWMASLKYFQRYYRFCDLSSYLNHWWCHQLLSKNFNQYLGNERRSFFFKKKMPFLLTLKGFSKKQSNIIFYFIGTLSFKLVTPKKCLSNFTTLPVKPFFLMVLNNADVSDEGLTLKNTSILNRWI